MTYTLAFYVKSQITVVKSFTTLVHGLKQEYSTLHYKVYPSLLYMGHYGNAFNDLLITLLTMTVLITINMDDITYNGITYN